MLFNERVMIAISNKDVGVIYRVSSTCEWKSGFFE